MTFTEQLNVAKTFIGTTVRVSDSPTNRHTPPEVGLCVDVASWTDSRHVDFVLESGSHYLMVIEDVDRSRCSGYAGVVPGPVSRTIDRLR